MKVPCFLIPNQELAERKALVPQDTRDNTARLMGDPIPGDRRMQLYPGEEKERKSYRGFDRWCLK